MKPKVNKSEAEVVKTEPIRSQRSQKGAKRKQKGAKMEPNGAKEPPKCIKKSIFVFGPFFGRHRGGRPGFMTTRSGTHFRPKIEKNRKKGIKKGMQKSMPKKYRKIMPKVIKNDAKMDTKINQFSNFSENG